MLPRLEAIEGEGNDDGRADKSRGQVGPSLPRELEVAM